jgi:hypothetical protein
MKPSIQTWHCCFWLSRPGGALMCGYEPPIPAPPLPGPCFQPIKCVTLVAPPPLPPPTPPRPVVTIVFIKQCVVFGHATLTAG